MGERIIDWRESEIEDFKSYLSYSVKHLKAVLDVIKELNKLIKTAFSGDEAGFKECFDRLNLNERKSDEIHENIVLRIMDATVSPPDREDLLDLSRLIELVAEGARDAGRLINIFYNVSAHLPKNFKNSIIKMSSTLECEINSLSISLELLKKDTKERAIKSTLKISELEQTIDELNILNLSMLRELKDIPAGLVILIHDFIKCIEEAADYGKDCSDLIRAIAIKRI
ncbi:MAG: DUF47 family protein [Candidatus Odinarchaeum yellowstonii]|uniref:DUF47 family protein n=1 Tax=Odinarchaeota yellowstonii (strain LCB_4) TaxID=1841599 RepID=A0AAF0IBN0_ODILC|nr:MAG: DUF47 family protein [Candidatus Odinarchaeum yellowstonii]